MIRLGVSNLGRALRMSCCFLSSSVELVSWGYGEGCEASSSLWTSSHVTACPKYKPHHGVKGMSDPVTDPSALRPKSGPLNACRESNVSPHKVRIARTIEDQQSMEWRLCCRGGGDMDGCTKYRGLCGKSFISQHHKYSQRAERLPFHQSCV
ncbi:hypothetical protein C8Q78DRAFT_573304 [Trametes maxima]|nr:hypothetical protein C8Q78DRAFT_573304 [Trametes maxima]